ncbi:hypothetical protein SIN8267_01296 [Sinobacterium norvegicum]|uniref:NlpC/P60 domain-containing protein n=1 Tax=Sinobacterium norvegicum TaxID=1641715 RepID=A0ABM9ADW5_9GAMM|nr:NlpC/P60 family protein [Sinobacterium norvegicum]CAH0991194.1 hypothetical protein SIN8267_01296 [Sinobacterium norvegicum]
MPYNSYIVSRAHYCLMRRCIIALSMVVLTACASSQQPSLLGSGDVTPVVAGKTRALLGGDNGTDHQQAGSSPSSVDGRLQQQYQLWQGVPYRYGGNSRAGIDCSAFVQTTFDQQFNQSLPRTTAQQSLVGRQIERTQLKSGDLIFFKTGVNSRHVGIYLGDGTFLHASTNLGVTITPLSDHYWRRHYWQSRRVAD